MHADDNDARAQSAAGKDEEPDAADGEIAIPDEFEITEADRDRDWNLACQVTARFFAGWLAMHGVEAGLIAVTSQPVVATILDSFRHIGRRRISHSAEALLDASDAAGVPLAEFFNRATADDQRHELLTRVLMAAQDTARRDKRRALGRALATGVMDDARIDEELMFVRAMDDIDGWHIALLEHMANNFPPMPPGWSARTAAEALPVITDVAPAVLGALALHGLISAVVPQIRQGPNMGQTFYNITDSGRRFLGRLREEAL